MAKEYLIKGFPIYLEKNGTFLLIYGRRIEGSLVDLPIILAFLTVLFVYA